MTKNTVENFFSKGNTFVLHTRGVVVAGLKEIGAAISQVAQKAARQAKRHGRVAVAGGATLVLTACAGETRYIVVQGAEMPQGAQATQVAQTASIPEALPVSSAKNTAVYVVPENNSITLGDVFSATAGALSLANAGIGVAGNVVAIGDSHMLNKANANYINAKAYREASRGTADIIYAKARQMEARGYRDSRIIEAQNRAQRYNPPKMGGHKPNSGSVTVTPGRNGTSVRNNLGNQYKNVNKVQKAKTAPRGRGGNRR